MARGGLCGEVGACSWPLAREDCGLQQRMAQLSDAGGHIHPRMPNPAERRPLLHTTTARSAAATRS